MRNKKILGLLLAGVMVTSIPFNVFADDAEPTGETVNPPAQGETVEKTPTAGDGTEVTYKLTFKFSDGRPDEIKTAKENETVGPPNLSDKKGFIFDGWMDDEGRYFTDTTKVTKDLTLHDKWTKYYVITFDLDGGYGVEESRVIENRQMKIPEDPKKDGYKFLGWYSDKAGTEKFDFDQLINSDKKVYAKWEQVKAPETEKVKVTFNSDGGSKVDPIEVEKGKTLKEPAAPTKDGFKFVEWQKDGEKFNFETAINENVELKAKWEKNVPVVPAKQDLYISDIEYDGNYVTGKVTSKGEAVKDATVTLKIDGSKTTYNDETDSNGRFKVYLGKYYDDYKYYYDDDYYYRDGYRYYDGYRVYRDSDGDYYYIKNGKRNYIRYSDYYRRYRDYKADLVAEKSGFYSAEKNLWKDGYYYNNGRYYGRDWYYGKYDHRVYPTDISRSNYSTSGYLKGYKNRTVYVYDDGTYLGSDTIDSDGYFKVSWNSPRVSTSRSLEYYVNGTYTSDSSYSMIPVVNDLAAGAKFVRGNAGAYADVTVYDSNGTRLGGASAGSTGIFNISLNRALKAGETIKVEAKESGKTSRSTEVKIAGQEAKVAAKVNSPSYIAGYPDRTFKPGREVTRAEAVRMFVQLVNEGKELPKNPTTKFKDANNKWYSDEINFAVSKGFISGYSDGTFKPNQGITRAEFAQMIAVFVKDGYPGSSNFKDVKGHWASNAIDQLYGNKKIKGFPDGTFKPDQKLTRAEAVTVLNSVFGRNTKSTSFANVNTSSLKKFSDVPMSHWAYYQIIDASNGHNAVKGDKAEDVSVWQ